MDYPPIARGISDWYVLVNIVSLISFEKLAKNDLSPS